MRLWTEGLTELHHELSSLARTFWIRIGSNRPASADTTERPDNLRMDVTKRTPSICTNSDGSIWNDDHLDAHRLGNKGGDTVLG